MDAERAEGVRTQQARTRGDAGGAPEDLLRRILELKEHL
jgi:hypothetical protein